MKPSHSSETPEEGSRSGDGLPTDPDEPQTRGSPAIAIAVLGVSAATLVLLIVTLIALLGLRPNKADGAGAAAEMKKEIAEDGEKTRQALAALTSQKELKALTDSVTSLAGIVVTDGEKTRQSVIDQGKRFQDAAAANDSNRAALNQSLDDLSKRLAEVRSRVESPAPAGTTGIPPPNASVANGAERQVAVEARPPAQQVPQVSSLYDEDGLRPVAVGSASSRGSEYVMYELAPGQLSREFSAREVRAGRVSVSAKYGLYARLNLTGWRTIDVEVPVSGGFMLPTDATGVSFYSRNDSFSIRVKK
ncbi:MAG TPA: hypothetical protein VHE10_01060 [Candidatus Paceibacterota bacterium]|nr:hypothetical protein [Candidatus Paceibacterota bacterium]